LHSAGRVLIAAGNQRASIAGQSNLQRRAGNNAGSGKKKGFAVSRKALRKFQHLGEEPAQCADQSKPSPMHINAG
ncbi:hypothetical protein O6466_25415, partial [Salmonella enterica subsp. enterica]